MNKKDLHSQVDSNYLNNFSYRVQREIPVGDSELERLINEKLVNSWVVDTQVGTQTSREENCVRRKALVDKVFIAASKVLTDIQYQIFSAYFVVGMNEIQIAKDFNVTQPYVSLVLNACIKKIKRHLNLTSK